MVYNFFVGKNMEKAGVSRLRIALTRRRGSISGSHLRCHGLRPSFKTCETSWINSIHSEKNV